MPKKFAVHILPRANQNLKDIIYYIAINRESIFNAERVQSAIMKRIMNLTIFPEGNPLVPEEPFLSNSVRMVHVKHYTIYYIVDTKSTTVYIIGISHARRSRDFLLKDAN